MERWPVARSSHGNNLRHPKSNETLWNDRSRDNMLHGEQTGLAQSDARGTIRKLPLVSRLSPGHIRTYWLAWCRPKKENLLLAQVNRSLGLLSHPRSRSQLLCSPGFSPAVLYLVDPVPHRAAPPQGQPIPEAGSVSLALVWHSLPSSFSHEELQYKVQQAAP